MTINNDFLAATTTLNRITRQPQGGGNKRSAQKSAGDIDAGLRIAESLRGDDKESLSNKLSTSDVNQDKERFVCPAEPFDCRVSPEPLMVTLVIMNFSPFSSSPYRSCRIREDCGGGKSPPYCP